MKTILKELALNDFRSFEGFHSISLPEKGLVLLNGVSGSGKTNIFQAIAYALGYSSIPSTKMTHWGKESHNVGLDFSQNNQNYSINKGELNTLFNHQTNKSVQGKSVSAELEKLIGLNSELLAALTYRPQRKPGLFLSKTDSKKKEFLIQVLQLDKFERAIETTKNNVKDLENQLVSSRNQKEFINSKYEASKQSLGKPPDDKILSKLAKATEEALEADSALEAFSLQESKITNLVKELKPKIEHDFSEKAHKFTHLVRHGAEIDRSHLIKLQSGLEQLQSQSRNLYQEHESKVTEFREKQKLQKQELQSLSLEEATLQQKILNSQGLDERELSINNSSCYACGAPLNNKQLTKEKLVLDVKILELNKNKELLKDIKTKQDRLRYSLKEVEPIPNPEFNQVLQEEERFGYLIENEITNIESQINNSKAIAMEELEKLNDLKDEALQQILFVPEIKQYYQGLRQATDKASELEAKVDLLEPEHRAYGIAKAVYDSDSLKLVQLEFELHNSFKSENEISDNLNFEKDLLALYKEFLGSIFDEVLEEISNKSNDLLARIPNTDKFTIEFLSERETLKGETKQEIKCMVRTGENLYKVEDVCSGGQMSVVELAVDLALGEVISNRTGVNPGWIILDEALDGLGAVEKEACMELLQDYSQNKLVLVVDHDSSLKAMFSKVINVKMTNGISAIDSVSDLA